MKDYFLITLKKLVTTVQMTERVLKEAPTSSHRRNGLQWSRLYTESATCFALTMGPTHSTTRLKNIIPSSSYPLSSLVFSNMWNSAKEFTD